MAPKEKQKIEIEKSHRDPLLSFNQAVTVDYSDFLGTALIYYEKFRLDATELTNRCSIRGIHQTALLRNQFRQELPALERELPPHRGTEAESKSED